MSILISILLFIVFVLLILNLFQAYRFDRLLKILNKPIPYNHNSPLQQNIAAAVKEKGQVEVFAIIYDELYLLKKQLMNKGTIDPEVDFLLAEVYEAFYEHDQKAKDANK